MKKFLSVIITVLFIFHNYSINAVEPPKVPAEILKKTYIYEIVRHLYRWYLDEVDVENAAANPKLLLKIFPLDTKLDAGDKSEYAEIFIPVFKISVKLKKSDYRIDELDIDVKSKTFMIINVSRVSEDYRIPDNASILEIDIKEMKDYLFKMRNFVEFPSTELFERIRKSLRDEIGMTEEQEAKLPASAKTGEQIVHLAPLSPIVNEIWIFWENGRMLFRCTSDIDLTNQSLWEHDPLSFRIYDVYNQMVVAHEEQAGDNSFLTRDQVGRALYNCIVLGRRLSVPKPEKEKKK